MRVTPTHTLTRRARRRPAWLVPLGVALLVAGDALRRLAHALLAEDRWIGLVLAVISGYLFLHVIGWVSR